MKCNKVISADNYTCDCGADDWTKDYRLIDVKYRLSPAEEIEAIQAFEDYDLDHPDGILQYFFTPHPEYAHYVDLKVGLTEFLPLHNLSRSYGPKIFLKNEGGNPSGCFKDRETLMAALHSMAEGKQKAVIYSSGNAAASAALFAARLNFQLITCVAGDTYPEKINYIREKGSSVIRIGDRKTNFEEGYRLFSQLNAEGFFTENGFDNWSVRNPFRVVGDKTTAIEIVKQFREETGRPSAVPDYVVVSTGNGSCLAGIWRGFKELRKLGIIDKYPKMVSAAIKNASPVYKAFKKKMTHRPAVCDLEEVPESDKEIGSVLLAEEGYDSVEATRGIIESGGLAVGVRRRDIRRALMDLMKQEAQLSIEHDLLPEPASLVTLAAIKKMKKRGIFDKNATAVAVISGHGAKAKDLLMKMLRLRPKLQKVMQTIIEGHRQKQRRFTSTSKGELVQVDANKGELKKAFRQLDELSFELS